jgi:hypothetical protein
MIPGSIAEDQTALRVEDLSSRSRGEFDFRMRPTGIQTNDSAFSNRGFAEKRELSRAGYDRTYQQSTTDQDEDNTRYELHSLSMRPQFPVCPYLQEPRELYRITTRPAQQCKFSSALCSALSSSHRPAQSLGSKAPVCLKRALWVWICYGGQRRPLPFRSKRVARASPRGRST